MEKITKNLDRISLHDSKILSFNFEDTLLLIELDWSKLSNFKEMSIKNEIVIGHTIIEIVNPKNIVIELFYSGTPGFENKPNEYIQVEQFDFRVLNEILEYKFDESRNVFGFSGFYIHNSIDCWIEFKMTYDKFSFSFEKYISKEEWLKGMSIN